MIMISALLTLSCLGESPVSATTDLLEKWAAIWESEATISHHEAPTLRTLSRQQLTDAIIDASQALHLVSPQKSPEGGSWHMTWAATSRLNHPWEFVSAGLGTLRQRNPQTKVPRDVLDRLADHYARVLLRDDDPFSASLYRYDESRPEYGIRFQYCGIEEGSGMALISLDESSGLPVEITLPRLTVKLPPPAVVASLKLVSREELEARAVNEYRRGGFTGMARSSGMEIVWSRGAMLREAAFPTGSAQRGWGSRYTHCLAFEPIFCSIRKGSYWFHRTALEATTGALIAETEEEFKTIGDSAELLNVKLRQSRVKILSGKHWKTTQLKKAAAPMVHAEKPTAVVVKDGEFIHFGAKKWPGDLISIGAYWYRIVK